MTLHMFSCSPIQSVDRVCDEPLHSYGTMLHLKLLVLQKCQGLTTIMLDPRTEPISQWFCLEWVWNIWMQQWNLFCFPGSIHNTIDLLRIIFTTQISEDIKGKASCEPSPSIYFSLRRNPHWSQRNAIAMVWIERLHMWIGGKKFCTPSEWLRVPPTYWVTGTSGIIDNWSKRFPEQQEFLNVANAIRGDR